jgi:hypothetical protein
MACTACSIATKVEEHAVSMENDGPFSPSAWETRPLNPEFATPMFENGPMSSFGVLFTQAASVQQPTKTPVFELFRASLSKPPFQSDS